MRAPFAGYVWTGTVRSVEARWTVPTIASTSRGGFAATWIGAQAKLAATAQPFIQVGTNESAGHLDGHRRAADWSFWSDKAHGFHPQTLFGVATADHMDASMRHSHGGWTLTIRDESSGRSARFTTAQEARPRFGVALWLQEDPKAPNGHEVLPYPAVGAVSFHRLEIDGVAPRYAAVRSQWMSVNGRSFGPTPLSDDAFSLRPERPTAPAADYLRMADGVDRAEIAFAKAISAPGLHAVPGHRGDASTAMAEALERFTNELQRTEWPRPARASISALVANNRRALDLIRTPAGPGSLGAWRKNVIAALAAAAHQAQHVRRALGLPQIFQAP